MNYNLDKNFIETADEEQLKQFIDLCEKSFDDSLYSCARFIAQNHDIKLVALAGPSGAGKTTSSHKIAYFLKEFNKNVKVISLDNFFKNRDQVPLLESRQPDYENFDCLESSLMTEVFNKILKGEKTYLPYYNFIKGTRRDDIELFCARENDIVLIEGIHALNDRIFSLLDDPKTGVFKIFINVTDDYCLDGEFILSNEDTRFMRRTIRDEKFRGASVSHTFELWENVLAGEHKYIYPFMDRADYKINSMFSYEIALMKIPALKALTNLGKDSIYFKKAQEMVKNLQRAPEIDIKYLPPLSLLTEFYGGPSVLLGDLKE